ncbi:MAG: ABC transporter permease subunit [Firmicutes bacterium]|nr:ABC transporter permease subunit [Bacillota bacterium]
MRGPDGVRREAAGRPTSDALWLAGVAVLTYAAYSAFRPFKGSAAQMVVSLRPLPLYALYSLARMAAAYLLALVFSVCYGYAAASGRAAGRVLLPLLDVLQSVPVLGFFPAAVYFFVSAFNGSRLGVEAASVFLIFTSQVWNMTFGVYESLTTIPEDLSLASRAYRLEGFLRLKTLVLPACVNRLVYNSMLSWAGGWYFLIACEIIALGPVNLSLPGLGSFLIGAAESGDVPLLLAGLTALVLVIWAVDRLAWRPLGAFAERFKYEYGGGVPSFAAGAGGFAVWRRWPLRVLASLIARLAGAVLELVSVGSNAAARLRAGRAAAAARRVARRHLSPRFAKVILAGSAAIAASYLGYRLWAIVRPPWSPDARDIPAALLASFLRLGAAYALSLAWTLPAAEARFMLPVVLTTRKIMNLASIILVLTGMQWYLLFNLVGAVRAIPADLLSVARAYGIRGRLYVFSVILPAIVPSLVTGSITAWGGGWNALIVSEYVVYGGKTFEAFGIGALLDRATYLGGDVKTISLSIFAMVLAVVATNRLVWRPLYDYAVRRYRIDY